MTERSASASGVVETVNVGTPRAVQANGHTVLTAIWKHPFEGKFWLRWATEPLGGDAYKTTVKVDGQPLTIELRKV